MRARHERKMLYRMDPATGKIEGEPTEVIGEGGNFVARKKDVRGFPRALRGKATAGSRIKLVEKKNPAKNFVRFKAKPTIGNSRSELAQTKNFEFGERVKINIEFKVKAKKLNQLNGYILQFWQPVVSPIAGVRVANGRLEVVTRTAGGAASMRLTSDWQKLEIVFTAGRNGELTVSGDLNGSVNGFINAGSQASLARQDTFRAKFGWYGTTGQRVQVRFREFRLERL